MITSRDGRFTRLDIQSGCPIFTESGGYLYFCRPGAQKNYPTKPGMVQFWAGIGIGRTDFGTGRARISTPSSVQRRITYCVAQLSQSQKYLRIPIGFLLQPVMFLGSHSMRKSRPPRKYFNSAAHSRFVQDRCIVTSSFTALSKVLK